MLRYKNLKVWQLSHELTLNIYRLTQRFPSEEKFGIISQLRRAAYSVPSNIVEGKGRRSKKEFAHYLTIARGSVEEVAYFLLLSKDLNYISSEDFEIYSESCAHISAMLTKLIKREMGNG